MDEIAIFGLHMSKPANTGEREKLIKEAENILHRDFEKSDDVMAIFDTEMNYLAVNQSACNLLGKTREELEGKNMLQLFPQLTASASHRHLLAAISSGENIIEAPSEGNITREGAKFLTNYYPLKNNGKVYSVVCITKKVYFP
jgi:PAS domain S-box-containing protein